ncbi:DUF4136 domain-containing protein [Novosphingobium guangzhouense]|uniref:DUF4136 domain-containing protein n=1 Tax=Novosphingobium guangzhouense TaxID=1850347 RepID=A0A2K2G3C9_9SPHN|nr:DUF4136 domain-containing protein [Novosphingobium guangzhouense]PNU05537.1 hypothetical protein A8V01_16315 [Novosphingobium guangzhouense]
MILRAATLVSAVFLASCATAPTVKYDADTSADFTRLRTYSWAYSTAPQGANPLTVQKVKASVNAYLASRGYTQAEPGDFALGFTLGARDRVEVTQLGNYGPYYRPWGPYAGFGGWGAGYNSVNVRNVTDGMLAVDIYDSRTKAPVWHGTATQQISGDTPSQATIDGAVSAVLAKFPPPADQK